MLGGLRESLCFRARPVATVRPPPGGCMKHASHKRLAVGCLAMPSAGEPAAGGARRSVPGPGEHVSWKLDDSPPGHSWTPTGLLAQKARRGWHDEDRGRPFGPARPSDASAGAYRAPIRKLVASWRSDLEPQLATSSSPSVGRKWPEAPGIHRA